MSLDKVRNHFEEEAFKYDELITSIIPKYNEQNDVMLTLIHFDKSDSIKVLDLGCGTGILSYLILNEFPKAGVVAFDLAENMLAACENNLIYYKDRVTFKQGNFGQDDIGVGYDLIVSGLATHHLNDVEKPGLYKKIYDALKPGGVFINREVVLGDSPELTNQYHHLWREYIRSNGEDDEKWFNKYLEEDIPASVNVQTDWLNKIGFVHVGCHWRYLNYAIFGGRKL